MLRRAAEDPEGGGLTEVQACNNEEGSLVVLLHPRELLRARTKPFLFGKKCPLERGSRNLCQRKRCCRQFMRLLSGMYLFFRWTCSLGCVQCSNSGAVEMVRKVRATSHNQGKPVTRLEKMVGLATYFEYIRRVSFGASR